MESSTVFDKLLTIFILIVVIVSTYFFIRNLYGDSQMNKKLSVLTSLRFKKQFKTEWTVPL